MALKEGIIIANEETKEEILRGTTGLLDYTFISEADLIKGLYGSPKKEAIFYLRNEYDLPYEVAMDYLKYMPTILNKSYNSLKLDSIGAAKRALIENKLYDVDPLFKLKLKGKNITIIDFNNVAIKEDVIAILNSIAKVELYSLPENTYTHKAYSYPNGLYEALDIMNKIKELYLNGTSLNDIYILNMDSSYLNIFKRLSLEYNIPIAFPKESNILLFDLPKKFISYLEVYDTFDEILDNLDSTDPYYRPIMNILINYRLKDKRPIDYKDFLIEELKRMKADSDIYKDMVRTNLKTSYKAFEHVFFVGCNLGSTPRIYKDDEYLKDSELSLISFPTSVIKNSESKKSLKNLFNSTKNLYISYKEIEGKDSLLPANILGELNIEVEERIPELGHNELEDRLRLGVAYTRYMKYKEEGSDLSLDSDIHYNEFDNKYKKISRERLDLRFNERPLKLSYSSINKYYLCPFRYFAERVLDLDEFKSNSAARLGSFSHQVLEDSYSEDFNFLESTTNAILKYRDDEEEYKDYFYMNQMKEVLKELIAFNKEHESQSDLDMVERELDITYSEPLFTFQGIIDKLLYKIDGDDVYCAIIDYKTGSDKVSLDNVKDGFNLQLPIYMVLLNKYEGFKGKNIHIIGIYLQKVNIIALDNTLDITEQRRKAFMLQGFSVKSVPLINMLDKSFNSSDYIKSMSVKKDGGFGRYAKLMTPAEINELEATALDLINKAAEGIRNGEFVIAPKLLKGLDKSCTFCKFKDLCYKSYSDVVEIEEDPFVKEED